MPLTGEGHRSPRDAIRAWLSKADNGSEDKPKGRDNTHNIREAITQDGEVSHHRASESSVQSMYGGLVATVSHGLHCSCSTNLSTQEERHQSILQPILPSASDYRRHFVHSHLLSTAKTAMTIRKVINASGDVVRLLRVPTLSRQWRLLRTRGPRIQLSGPDVTTQKADIVTVTAMF